MIRKFNDFIVKESANAPGEIDIFLGGFIGKYGFMQNLNNLAQKIDDGIGWVDITPINGRYYDKINIRIARKNGKTEVVSIDFNKINMLPKDFVVFSQNLEKLMKDVSKIDITEHIIED